VPGVAGERIEIALTLYDAEGAVVPDGLIEIWQANSHGRYDHPEDRRNLPLDAGFEGFGRASTDGRGCARFATVKPGRVPWPAGGLQAAHINVSVFARGVLNRLATRLYFDGDPALAEDPVLKLVEPTRHATLIARRDETGVWQLVNGRARFKPVRIGMQSQEGVVQILSGLAEGERGIVYSSMQLRSDARVREQKVAPP